MVSDPRIVRLLLAARRFIHTAAWQVVLMSAAAAAAAAASAVGVDSYAHQSRRLTCLIRSAA
jgi:hypothetical protein